MEADSAGYMFVLEESTCFEHNIKPIDTMLKITRVPAREYVEQSTDISPETPGGSSVYTEGMRSDPSNADAQIRPPTVNGIVESEVVRFIDENPGTLIDYTAIPDADQYADIQPDTDLTDFLSRPVLIDTQTYNMSTSVGSMGSFKPWRLFFSNTVIKNKLQNYAYLSCKLHVKTIVNCSPFYYGNAIYSYLPSSAWVRGPNIGNPLAIIQTSQLPHYWVYPQSSQGGELVLPFFWHKTYMDITTAAEDVDQIGTMLKWALTPLKSANGAATGNATLQTYAWATDVRLHAPTIRLAMQSQDEYGDGYVSRPASAIATALGYLNSIPVIGKYATATSMVSSTVGRIAHLFGYSNPPNMSNVNYFKPTTAPHFASSDISVPFDKFSLDPKTELSIDPSLVGLSNVDELNISYLCQKESFLCDFAWAQSDSIDLLSFAARVTPNMFNVDTGTTPNTIYDTPVSYISRMFQYWRGDLIFRFRFICSPYHKGRIRLSYDPRGDIANNIPDYSAIFNQIVDIGTVQDVEIRVPYMQTMPWLSTLGTNYSSGALNWATSGTATSMTAMTYQNARNNGVITWRVVTPLTAPTTTAGVTVQVFVRGAENFELAVPTQLGDYSPYVTQSTDIIDNLGSYDNPMLILAGNATAEPPKSRYLNNIGENVVSMRKLLRRTVYHSTCSYYDTGDNTGKINIMSIAHNRIPPLHGFDTTNGTTQSKGVVTTATTFNCNIVKNSTFTWLYPCFAGLKGGFNWHHYWNSLCLPSGAGGASKISTPNQFPIMSLSAGRSTSSPITGTLVYNVQHTLAPAYANVCFSRAQTGVESSSNTGMALQSPNVINNTVSFVAPNYNMYKLNYCTLNNSCGSKYALGDTLETGTVNDNYQSTAMVAASSANPVLTTVDRYFSVGTDFTFLYFLCTPHYQLCNIGSMNPQ